jgi:hypothetical protein
MKKKSRGRPMLPDSERKVRLGSIYIPQDCAEHINGLVNGSGESRNVIVERIIRRDMARKSRKK